MSAILAKYLIEMNTALNNIKDAIGTGVTDEQLAAAIEEYLTENKPTYTADEVGAVPKSGGTMTGALTVPSPLTVVGANYPAYTAKQSNSGKELGAVTFHVADRKWYFTAYDSDMDSATTRYKTVFTLPSAGEGLTTDKWFYIPAADGSAVGGTAKPVYVSGAKVKACSATVGSATKPVYMDGGMVTECSRTISAQLEFNSGALSTSTYSYSGSASKFYIVTLYKSGSESNRVPIAIAYKDLSTTAHKYYATTFDANLSSGSVGVSVVLNSSGHPTFTTAGSNAKLSNVCGYY